MEEQPDLNHDMNWPHTLSLPLSANTEQQLGSELGYFYRKLQK